MKIKLLESGLSAYYKKVSFAFEFEIVDTTNTPEFQELVNNYKKLAEIMEDKIKECFQLEEDFEWGSNPFYVDVVKIEVVNAEFERGGETTHNTIVGDGRITVVIGNYIGDKLISYWEI